MPTQSCCLLVWVLIGSYHASASAPNTQMFHSQLEDYSAEWLTPKPLGTCAKQTLKGIGLTVNGIFNKTSSPSAEQCCVFCHSQTSQKCVVWTWHSKTKICYVADRATKHEASDAVSGMAPAPAPPSPLPKPVPPLGFQPNIVFILTDDQDTTLGRHDYTRIGSLEAMPQLRARVAAKGVSMDHFYVNTPICCPSRTEFMSGRYYHNVGPPNIEGSCMHTDTSFVSSNQTGMFGLLRRAGYNVGVFGKVTNDQGSILKQAVVEESMDYIDAPINYNSYDGLPYFRRYSNGTVETETIDAKNPIFGTTYQTSQIGNRTLRWLEGAIAKSKSEHSPQPFFAYLGPHAPHFPAEPAPWYRDSFNDLDIPLTPNYNMSCPLKAQHIRQNGGLTAQAHCWENQHFRNRWRTLLSVDDLVSAVLDSLETAQIMNQTFVVYSSDHGYKQGQWRVPTSKQHPYETDIRVPFMIRGPGIPADVNMSAVAGNVDVLPTLLDLAAGADFVRAVGMDGRSMARLLVPALRSEAKPWRTAFLNEYKSVGTYFNDHSGTWEDNGTTTKQCGGPMPRGPDDTKSKKCIESTGVGDGNCYFVDSTHSNSWRQLRVVNSSMNINYIEYDPDFKFTAGVPLQHYEMYDQQADPYQMHNIYSQQSDQVKQALHEQLVAYFLCKGNACP